MGEGYNNRRRLSRDEGIFMPHRDPRDGAQDRFEYHQRRASGLPGRATPVPIGHSSAVRHIDVQNGATPVPMPRIEQLPSSASPLYGRGEGIPTNPLDQVKKEIDDEHRERMGRIDEEIEGHRQRRDRAEAQGQEMDQRQLDIIRKKKEAQLSGRGDGGESREEQAQRFQGARERLRRSQEGDGTVYSVDRAGRRTPRRVQRGLTDVRTNLTHGLDGRSGAPQRFDGGAIRIARDLYDDSPDAEARRLGYASADDFIGARGEESADDIINRSLGEIKESGEERRTRTPGQLANAAARRLREQREQQTSRRLARRAVDHRAAASRQGVEQGRAAAVRLANQRRERASRAANAAARGDVGGRVAMSEPADVSYGMERTPVEEPDSFMSSVEASLSDPRPGRARPRGLGTTSSSTALTDSSGRTVGQEARRVADEVYSLRGLVDSVTPHLLGGEAGDRFREYVAQRDRMRGSR